MCPFPFLNVLLLSSWGSFLFFSFFGFVEPTHHHVAEFFPPITVGLVREFFLRMLVNSKALIRA